MKSTQSVTVGEQVISSSLWMGSWRWSARLIGFVTTIILARLLIPEDFGVVATASIIVGFFGILSELGTESYLIRHQDPSDVDYNTAWTLRIIVISFLSIAVIVFAQQGADFFADQRLTLVLQVIAVAGWLSSFANIGLTKFRREMQFKQIALIGITQRLSSTFVTLALAYWLRNYWAMVIGEIVFMLVGLVLSYTRHNYRPSFSIKKIKQQWAFSKWIIVQNLATFLQGQGDNFVIAKFFGIQTMGIYSMGMRFAAMPTKQVLAPVLPPIYSGLAKKQHDDDDFRAGVIKVIGAVMVLMLPAAILFEGLDEALITTLLGDRWISVIPLVAPLTFSIMLVVITNPVVTALTIKGRVKLLAGLNWFSAISVVTTLILAASWQEIEILVWARVVITLTLVIIYYSFLRVILNISLAALLSCIYRPIVASLVLMLFIHTLSEFIESPLLLIISAVILGGVAYIFSSFVLWRIAGSPDSGEALLVNKLIKVISRVMKK